MGYPARNDKRAAVALHIRFKFRRCQRMNEKFIKDGKLPNRATRQLNRAVEKWRRASFHKIAQVKAKAIVREKKKAHPLYRPPSLKQIYREFARGKHNFIEHHQHNPDEQSLYNRNSKEVKTEAARQKRNDQRRRQSQNRMELAKQQAEAAGIEYKPYVHIPKPTAAPGAKSKTR